MSTKPDTPSATSPLVEVRDLSVHFELRGGTLARLFGRDTGTIKAVDGVNLSLHPVKFWGWSARAAVASPRWVVRFSAWCPRRGVRSTFAT